MGKHTAAGVRDGQAFDARSFDARLAEVPTAGSRRALRAAARAARVQNTQVNHAVAVHSAVAIDSDTAALTAGHIEAPSFAASSAVMQQPSADPAPVFTPAITTFNAPAQRVLSLSPRRSRAVASLVALTAVGIASSAMTTSLSGAFAQPSATDGSAAATPVASATSISQLAHFQVTVDGYTRTIAGAATLGDALSAAGISLGAMDEVSAPLAGAVRADQHVTIVRVAIKTVQETETDAFSSSKKDDPTLLKGTQKVLTKGVDGKIQKTYQVTYRDGVEASRVLVASAQTSRRQDEVVGVGTKSAESAGSGEGAGSGSLAGAAGSSAKVVPAGTAQQIAHSMVLARGWSEADFAALVKLWNRESGWQTTAANPTSSAYGIPQALPGSKMASAGADWRTNPVTQIKWGLNYIAGRYGSPRAALAHSNSIGWY
ncbi:MAG: G5 domain-containing protein [Actinomycetaceae bacterium]|nr:G5 domain-containing protein [Actinomycetaceae bacterium]MDY6083537.1 G5 domain-containing protein [Actinomycetaceae bacterium]